MKKAMLIFVLGVLICMISSCVNDIEDTNGDSTELCYYTEQDILNSKYKVSKIGSSLLQENNLYTYTVIKMNGIEKIKTLKAKNQSITIKVDFQIKYGNAKLVLCNDESIIYTFNANDQFVINPSDGELKLVIACESCKFSLKYQIIESGLK